MYFAFQRLIPFIVLYASLCMGAPLDMAFSPMPTQPCKPSLLGTPCKSQNFEYSKPFDPNIDGTSTLHYSFTKFSNSDQASISAKYSYNKFTGKITGSYKNNPLSMTSSSDTKVHLAYETLLWEGFTAHAAENIIIPVQGANPSSFTSLLETRYTLAENYQLVTSGSYSYLSASQLSSNTALTNPYSASAGITHHQGSKTSIKALYSQSKDQNPALKSNQSMKLIARHKLTKKLNTTISIKKSLDSIQENNGIIDIYYTF